jgi:hypothetical protein
VVQTHGRYTKHDASSSRGKHNIIFCWIKKYRISLWLYILASKLIARTMDSHII